LVKPKKKPPPDTPANLAGRARLRREQAWQNACGGIWIIVGKEGESPGRPAKREIPEDVQERYKQELARLEREWKAKRKKAVEAPSERPKADTPPDKDGADLIDFLLS